MSQFIKQVLTFDKKKKSFYAKQLVIPFVKVVVLCNFIKLYIMSQCYSLKHKPGVLL